MGDVANEHATAYCGGAVILHTQNAWLMQHRSAACGGDCGLSAGGFGNLDKLETQPVGTIMLAVDEVYREMTEELPVTKAMFTLGYFRNNAKQLLTFSVRRPRGIHVCTFFSLELRPDALHHIATSPPDPAEVEAVSTVPFLPYTSRLVSFTELKEFYPKFHYEHELLALLALTNQQLHSYNGLNYDQPNLLPI